MSVQVQNGKDATNPDSLAYFPVLYTSRHVYLIFPSDEK